MTMRNPVFRELLEMVAICGRLSSREKKKKSSYGRVFFCLELKWHLRK